MNLVQGEVASVAHVGNRVRVRVGPLTAEVTEASAERLDLTVGSRIYASFKATGTRLVPLGRSERISPQQPASPGLSGR
jgi:molybdopterin-binding protein